MPLMARNGNLRQQPPSNLSSNPSKPTTILSCVGHDTKHQPFHSGSIDLSNMASFSLLSQTMRSSQTLATSTKTLASSMRALTLTPSLAVRSSAQQTRCLSQSSLHPKSCQRPCCRPTIMTKSLATGAGNGLASFQSQQTRGMKVHSSIKKRCEHCKVC